MINRSSQQIVTGGERSPWDEGILTWIIVPPPPGRMVSWYAKPLREFCPMKQPGLNHRHRDKDGTIARKHGNTLISTLRQTYGQKFAPGIDGNAKLSDVLHQLDKPSLTHLMRDTH